MRDGTHVGVTWVVCFPASIRESGFQTGTSRTDHFVAWRVCNTLGFDHFGPSGAAVGGVSGDPDHPDNIIFDFSRTANGGILNPNPNTDPNKGMAVSGAGGSVTPFVMPGMGRSTPKRCLRCSIISRR
jgi:hypothetical protein